MTASATCPACGFSGLVSEPWDDVSPSDEICPCCGIQFGLDDWELVASEPHGNSLGGVAFEIDDRPLVFLTTLDDEMLIGEAATVEADESYRLMEFRLEPVPQVRDA